MLMQLGCVGVARVLGAFASMLELDFIAIIAIIVVVAIQAARGARRWCGFFTFPFGR